MVVDLVVPPNRPSQKIGELDESGRGRVDEERDFSEIAQGVPSSPLAPEARGETLKRVLVAGLVHYDEAATRHVVARVETAQVQIEAVADLFERELDWIFVADRLFVYDDAEGPNALMCPS